MVKRIGLLGAGATVLALVALSTLRRSESPRAVTNDAGAGASDIAAAAAAAEPRRRPAVRVANPEVPDRAAHRGDVELEPAVEDAKLAFEDALAQLRPGTDPDRLGRAVRRASRALAALEDETDPENPDHRRLHTQALAQLATRLRAIDNVEH